MEAGRTGEGKTKTFLKRKGNGESAVRLPLVGDDVLRTVKKKVLTKPAFSWKPRPQGAVFQLQ
jgi:hypothetical protein